MRETSRKTAAKKAATDRSIPTLIRILTIAGLSAGFASVLFVGLFLALTTTQAERHQAQSHVTPALRATIANHVKNLDEEMLALLFSKHEVPEPSDARSTDLASLFELEGVSPDVNRASARIHAILVAGRRLAAVLRDMRNESDQIRRDHEQASLKAKSLIHELESVVSTQLDRIRLVRALDYLKLRKDPSDREATARLLNAHLQRNESMLLQLRRELRELLTHTHAITAASDVSRLDDLANNNIGIIMRRTHRILSDKYLKLEAPIDFESRFKTLETLLLGHAHRLNPRTLEIRPGIGGLLPLRRQIVEMEKTRYVHFQDVLEWHARTRTQLNSLEKALETQGTLDAATLSETVQLTFGVLFALSLLSGTIFVWIALRTNKLAKLQIEHLDEARKDANAAAEAKTRFLANMSHEIRTPMNGIVGMVDLLAETKLTREQEQMSRTIHGSSTALLKIINDILDFSKVEADKFDLLLDDFDLRTTIEDSASLFAGTAHEKNLEVISFIDPRIWPCHIGDCDRIRQIILNLTSNAIKFTQEGVVKIEAMLVGEEIGAQIVRIEVEDSGIGISKEACGTLFKPFTQAEVSTTRRFGGTGLGLAISKKFVTLMGGEIKVDSQLGKGSRFFFDVRLEKGDRPVIDKKEMNFGGKAILVVDNVEAVRDVMLQHLVTTKADLDTAKSTPHALRILRLAARRGRPFDLVLIDRDMPEVSGLDLARAIVADEDLASPILVMASMVGDQAAHDVVKQLGIAGWISKPIRERELLETIGRALLQSEGDPELCHGLLAAPKALPANVTKMDLSILVAEDNDVNRKVVGLMLEKLGCKVKFACDGLEAVQHISRDSFDLVLMDCQMPVMDGLEATRSIRDLEIEAKDIPIIALTANVLPEDREACIAAGMDDFLSKPVRRELLEETLQRWTEANQSG